MHMWNLRLSVSIESALKLSFERSNQTPFVEVINFLNHDLLAASN